MKRNISIDSIRGLAIVLMVFGHCIQCGSGQLFFDNHFYFDIFLYKVIYSFHMPLFAFVSGLFIYSSINKRGWGGVY